MGTGQFVIEVSEANFQAEVIARSRQVPVVVDFWAPWCGPCRMLGPVLEKLVREYNGSFILAKLNTDENQRLAMQFGIQGIPAVKGFRDGRVVAEFVGALPEPQVRQFLQRLGVGRPAATQGPDPEALLAAGRYVEAEAVYRRLLASGNGNQPALNLGLAKALLGQGKGQPARQLLEGITEGPEVAAAQTLLPLAIMLTLAPSEVNGGGEIASLYQRAVQGMTAGDLRKAMDALLDVLRRDKRYRNGEPRQAMLAIFALLGDEHPLTREYRTKLASVLF
ncbi:MAG: thioredoxin [Anaerolineae bacterium]